MRKDHYLPPSKWTREFRRALRLSDAHFKVYAYLESGIESHRTGIYFINLASIGEMVGEDRETVGSIIDDLERVGLVLWDREASVIWVPCVCAEQFRWRRQQTAWKAADYKVIEARRHLELLPPSRLVEMFLAQWPAFAPSEEGASQGASQAPSQGASQGAWQGSFSSTCSFSQPEGSFEGHPGGSGGSAGRKLGGLIR